MLNTREVRFEPSTICNYACSICPLGTGSFKRSGEVMTQDLFEKLIDKIREQAPQINTCTLSGMGEIFTDAGILSKIQYAADSGFDIHLLTNGSLLNKIIIKRLLKIGIKSIRISFHTPIPNHFTKITGTSALILKKLCQNIKYLSKHRGSTRLIITSNLTENFINDVEAIKKFCLPLVDLLEIWRPHNWASWGTYRQNIRQRITCGRPQHGPLQIQVDGTVNMCCFDFNGELLLGDLKKQSLQGIFNSNVYKKILKFHKNHKNKQNLLCKNCDQLHPADPGILIFNSGFIPSDRINKTSTIYENLN
jgi:radical SAM protein with 4Fe4S-binding SPASM domain